MKRIFKYPVNIVDFIEIEMPKGAEILSFQTQYEQPCIWAIVDPEAETEMRKFRVCGTGHELSAHLGKFIGTTQVSGGRLVWHLFEDAS